MKKYAILLLLAVFKSQLSTAQVGTWRAFMSYHDIQQIQSTGSDLFVLASYDLYQYNLNDHSITTYDKTNGLSDSRINHIAWNAKAKRLIAVYSNSNIDLIDTKGNVTNISALYNKTITGDKTVDSLTVDGVYAYLYARFGIVKVNMERAEISDSYTPNHPEYPRNLPPSNKADYDSYYELVSTLNPGGPKYNYFGFLRFTNNKLYSTTYTSNGSQQGCVQVLDSDRNWTFLEEDLQEKTGHDFKKLACVDEDPTNPHHVIASGRTGVYVFTDGVFTQEYNNYNSPIKTSSTLGKDTTNRNYVGMTGGKFDNEGNYWCVNSISPSTSLLELTKDGQWVSHHKEELMFYPDRSFEEMKNLMFDSRGLLWFVNDFYRGPSLVRYNKETDEIKVYKQVTNQDGMIYNPYYFRYCTEDKEGNIWIGTSLGAFYLSSDDAATGDGETMYQVKVPRNDGSDYADYLLNGVDVTDIAIDGGNRKWFATNGDGVYLISADNMTQIYHFKTDNSPLLSDDVETVEINPVTGEVFFGTGSGLCSFMSDAIEPVGDSSSEDLFVYPNPVTPDYQGMINITGFTADADIKIVNANGKLIHQGRSNGGMFTWDGTDSGGRRVASGVYTVLSATKDGKKSNTGKIAIVK